MKEIMAQKKISLTLDEALLCELEKQRAASLGDAGRVPSLPELIRGILKKHVASKPNGSQPANMFIEPGDSGFNF